MRNKTALLMVLIIIAIAWQIAGESKVVEFFVSNPINVMKYVDLNYKGLMSAFMVTLSEALFGLLIAIVSSYIFAILCEYVPSILAPLRAIFVISQVLPIITLAPIFILVLGMGAASKICMVSLMCFFPVFMNVIEGIHNIKLEASDFLDLYDASKSYRLFKIYIPLSMPNAFVGIQVGATLAVLGAIVAEFLGAYVGLGKNLYTAPKLANANLTMASAILTAIMGTMIFKIVRLAQKLLTKWDTV